MSSLRSSKIFTDCPQKISDVNETNAYISTLVKPQADQSTYGDKIKFHFRYAWHVKKDRKYLEIRFEY